MTTKVKKIETQIGPEAMSYKRFDAPTLVFWLNGGSQVYVDVNDIVPQTQLKKMEKYLQKELAKAVKNTLTKFEIK